jgi:hypothetical protein
VDDGCQPKVELIAKDRNVIAATFIHFLLKNIGTVTVKFPLKKVWDSFIPTTLFLISSFAYLSSISWLEKSADIAKPGYRKNWYPAWDWSYSHNHSHVKSL